MHGFFFSFFSSFFGLIELFLASFFFIYIYICLSSALHCNSCYTAHLHLLTGLPQHSLLCHQKHGTVDFAKSLSLFFFPPHNLIAAFLKVATVALILVPPLTPFWDCLDFSGVNKVPRHPACVNTSCGPRYGCTVLFGFHAQSGDAGGLAVGVHVEIVSVDASSHARRSSKQAAHVSLPHVTCGTRYSQKIRHPAGRVGVRCHARSHCVAGHNAARHGRRSAAAADPGRVLDLEYCWKINMSEAVTHLIILNAHSKKAKTTLAV